MEVIDLGYFPGSFGGTEDYVGGICVGLGVRGIMTASDIYAMQMNDSSPVYCRAEIYSLLGFTFFENLGILVLSGALGILTVSRDPLGELFYICISLFHLIVE